MPDEIELKLRIARKDAARLRHHPAILAASISKPLTRKLTSTYFDTPQLALLDAGVSLRVRRMSGNWFQAVKGAGSALSGLHQRSEWEDMIASDRPDFTRILDPGLQRIFSDQALRDALSPIFRTEVRRTEWHLAYDNGDSIELALDLGDLVVGKKKEPICEIELELTSGHAGRLFALALELQRDIPLELENVSKAKRGYGYFREPAHKIIKARLPELQREASANEAFKKIAWECLSQLQGNQDMVLHGDDVEGVHQMRVALRRLRSAFTVFRDTLGRENCSDLLAELEWLTDVLGVARDLDVFITQTLPPIMAQFEGHPGLVKLRLKALQARITAYVSVRTAMGSQRYHCLLLTLSDWLENEHWQTGNPGKTASSALEIGQATLSKRYKQVVRHGHRLVHMHPEERHATRIAAKKLRYAAEFFSCFYPAPRTRSLIQALSQLQDRLGVLNDIAVTEDLIRRLIGQRPDRSLDEAFHIFSGWNRCNAMHSLERMDESWRGFAAQKPFWR